MAKCDHYRNPDIGSHKHQHFRLWNAFSTATFRRKLFSALSCGASSYFSKKSKPTNPAAAATTIKRPELRSGPGSDLSGLTRPGSGKLSDLLKWSSSSCESERREKVEMEEDGEEVRRKEKRLEELREVVRMLQGDDVEERERGAKMVRGLTKEDGEARSTLAMLCAIPPLVAMLDHHHLHNHDHDHNFDDNDQKYDDDDDDDDKEDYVIEALYALLNLGIGNDMNKAAIVQAGAVHQMLKRIESSNGSLEKSISEAIVANFLALSALDSNKSIIGASGAISFLVTILVDSDTQSSSQAKQDSLRALYNLSIFAANIALILDSNLVKYLINSLGSTGVSERMLSILSNVVQAPEGRKAIGSVPDAFPILIDVLNWTDSPGCQEKASYILMVMAHKSYSDRQNMIEAGIGSALLELTLLGSTLSQKRASRILECLRMDKGKQISQSFHCDSSQAVSAPICRSSSTMISINKEEEAMMSEEKKAVKQLVQQSLNNNMKRIVKRANLPQDFVPSEHFKSLTASSTSKSLPF